MCNIFDISMIGFFGIVIILVISFNGLKEIILAFREKDYYDQE